MSWDKWNAEHKADAARASAASQKARQTGSSKDHSAAAVAHGKAADSARKLAGHQAVSQEHNAMARSHSAEATHARVRESRTPAQVSNPYGGRPKITPEGNATIKAIAASSKANTSGAYHDHLKAVDANLKAASLHREAGNVAAKNTHQSRADAHVSAIIKMGAPYPPLNR